MITKAKLQTQARGERYLYQKAICRAKSAICYHILNKFLTKHVKQPATVIQSRQRSFLSLTQPDAATTDSCSVQ